MKNLSQRQALELIEMVVFDEPGMHTDKEKLVEIIGQIYSIAHSHNKDHSCHYIHKAWRKRAAEMYPEMKKFIGL